jgi:pyruvate,water dikinase
MRFSREEIGGKAAAVARLYALELPGVKLPKSLVIPAAALTPVLARCNVADEIGLQHRVRAALPTKLVDQTARLFRHHALVIVRSSVVVEDGATQSFAGHFESVVCKPRDVGLAIARAAAVSAHVVARDISKKEAHRCVALLVQGTVESEKAAVAFSASPLHGDDTMMIVASYGTCHAIVDGTFATDTFLVRRARSSGEISYKQEMTVLAPDVFEMRAGQSIQTQLGETMFHWPYAPGLAVARVPPHAAGLAALRDDQVGEIATLLETLRQELGHEVDVEVAFDEGDLYLLQARPITARATHRARGQAPRNLQTIASPGVASGPARIVKNVEEIGRVTRGDVLVVTATDPAWLPAFRRACAVISEEGSPLSHTAIVAREMRLPCLVGVARATKGLLLDGELITVDADAGRIKTGRTRAVRHDEVRATLDLCCDARLFGAALGGVRRPRRMTARGRFCKITASALIDAVGGTSVDDALAFALARDLAIVWDIHDDRAVDGERDALVALLAARVR